MERHLEEWVLQIQAGGNGKVAAGSGSKGTHWRPRPCLICSTHWLQEMRSAFLESPAFQRLIRSGSQIKGR
ncbi:MAG: hypothetical protein KKF00_14915, partial [Proteobacteria bacterium]|nr:hypothetical protein [Pseudomonadota bacterium]